MDRAQVGLVSHSSSSSSSSSRWLGIRPSSIRTRLQLIGTEVVPNPQMHPYPNHRSHPMDTHQPPLALVIVNMHIPHIPHIPHMRQREAPQCTQRLSPLRPHSGPLAIILKVKSNIIIQELLPTHSQRKPISSHSTPPPRTRQERTRPIPPLDPLAVVLHQSHALHLPWRLDLFLPVPLYSWRRGRSLRRQGPRVLLPDLLQLSPLLVPRFPTEVAAEETQ